MNRLLTMWRIATERRNCRRLIDQRYKADLAALRLELDRRRRLGEFDGKREIA
jgi:hypothetical protein